MGHAPHGAVHARPVVQVRVNQFTLDQPSALAPRVTSRDLAHELDLYADWQVSRKFTASFVGAVADPGLAAQQAFNRTRTFVYGMAFLSYSY